MIKRIADEDIPIVERVLFNLAEQGYRLIAPDGTDLTSVILRVALMREGADE